MSDEDAIELDPAELAAATPPLPEPVSFELPFIDRESLGTARWLIRFLAGVAVVALVASRVVSGEEFATAFLALAIIAAYLTILFGASYLLLIKGRRSTVELRDRFMTVTRYGLFGRSAASYEVLRVHDLHVTPGLSDEEGMERVFLGPLLFVGFYSYRTAPTYAAQRIAFTYDGRAYGFGGIIREETAAPVVERIARYDEALRAHLGMKPEPNATTYDRARFVAAAEEGFNTNESPLRV